MGHYFLGSIDKRLIFHLEHTFHLNMYIDADFARTWYQGHSALWDCALSCMGFEITYCSYPMHWASKLQTEIDLSTTKSEYIALPMATCESLPIWRLVQEFHWQGFIVTPLNHTFSITYLPTLMASCIFYDNFSCIVLAYSNGTKQQTKNISLKCHHFWDQLHKGHIQITKVQTNLNWAGIFTKPICTDKH